MEPISSAINSLIEKDFANMRENIGLSLSQKAAAALEEKKVEIASTYFEQK